MKNINTAEHWDRAWGAEGAKTWRQYPACFEKIVEKIGSGKRVLDVGGGVGILSNRLKQAGNYPFIIDISLIAVQIAKACFDIDGLCAQVPPISFAGGGFDYLIATEFLEHIDDPDTFLMESNRLAPRAIYSVPDNVLGPEDEQEHVWKFDSQNLFALLEGHYKTIIIDSIRDRFYSGQGKLVDGQIIPVMTELPTLIAYCDV